MAKVKVDAGICGFSTEITAEQSEGGAVAIGFQSTCPHVVKARAELSSVDAYSEIFRKPHETRVYQALSAHLPHVACPLYSGFFKAIEVAAGLALPKDAHILVQK
jgi:hypothetical protein